MSAKILLRIAVFLLLFHVVGHSFGMASRKNVTQEKAKELLQNMSEVKVPMFGDDSAHTYDDFYFGMGVNLSIALLAFAALLWILSGLAASNPKEVVKVLYPILFCLLAFTGIDFAYFFPLPALTCLFAALAIIGAQVQLSKKS
ncbi:LIC_13387 family protein [Leptospira sp. SA-E8]|uniref:LIC_13387 family protein n=1 Tax=Leptospira sp. SA-E8 TaxID=3422259 RepID=UPI003EB7EEA9